MKKQKMSALLILPLALSLAGCSGNTTGDTELLEGTPVQTQVVEASSISNTNSVSGQVSSDRESTIFVAASVKCTKVNVEAGDTVQQGDVICTLDLASTQAAYNAAEISYQSNSSSYANQSKVFSEQITLLEKNVRDLKALYEIGAASQTEIDQAQLQLDNARATRDATLSQLEAGVESAKSQMKQLATVLEDVDAQGNVIAPMTGTLVTMNAEENAYLSADRPVAVINDAEAMKITVSVAETLAPKLSIGDSVDVSVSAANQQFQGTIRAVEKAANQATKLYTVTITVPKDVTGLLSGMFADVTFYTDVAQNVIVIPTEAILTSGTTQYVFTVAQDDTARYEEITTGITGEGVTEVTSGLTVGEELVTVGQSYLSDGDTVRVVNTASTTERASVEE